MNGDVVLTLDADGGSRSIAKSNMGSNEPIKLLYHFESDQVYDFWLIQPKVILI